MVTIAWIIAYLLVAIVVGRIIYRVLPRPEGWEPLIFGITWPLSVSIFALVGVGYGMHRLMTMPSLKDRRQAKRERLSREIAELERQLGVGG
jgi:tellurite resistance protein TehA-like permease